MQIYVHEDRYSKTSEATSLSTQLRGRTNARTKWIVPNKTTRQLSSARRIWKIISVVMPLQIIVFALNLQPTFPAISLIHSHFASFLCLWFFLIWNSSWLCFFFFQGQSTNINPGFICPGSELTGVLLVIIRSIYNLLCQMWRIITCQLPDALFKVSRWSHVQLLLG